MRILDLEALHVETTVMQPELEEGFEGGDFAASILWNTQTQPIRPNTNSSPCIA
jgi:hypothetical protein